MRAHTLTAAAHAKQQGSALPAVRFITFMAGASAGASASASSVSSTEEHSQGSSSTTYSDTTLKTFGLFQTH